MNCIVCGADVAKARLRADGVVGRNVNTCSPICTRARNNGRTREQQQWADDRYWQREKESRYLDLEHIPPVRYPFKNGHIINQKENEKDNL